ncbi:epoxide hydrolase [Actinobacteria bacterium YIM 96077]|uniref:Epoxide hydrolase n=1 Tax=Phytoactinopolyspora halophila TaxID=1981511 RepID=A0A329QZC7_9ACTN|nr:epoxide hydrolase family protein [Phytoactinopolyspora halophila]AYY15466.1 epoxide hydrolase [Actinobacteria bacterium YIM 96077]RAW17675.1 epoxide hydrolase [Phytoactinopolyspora halophila]
MTNTASATGATHETPSAQIHPFTIAIPQSDLDDLHERLNRTRFTQELPGAGWDYGVPIDHVRRLAEYWRDGYDWRAWEARLNAYPQFTTEIDGQNIHFLHVRSPEPDAFPLLLTHGWPGSIVEFLDVIEPLTDPRAFGGNPSTAFHLVIPSLPGFAFSGPTTEKGWDSKRIAAAWAELMRRLGYGRYGVHGNDAGSIISPCVGRIAGDSIAGVHVTQIFSFPSGDPAEMDGLSDEEQAGLAHLQWFWETMGAFNQLQSSQPQTLAHALADSPAGQLAWNAQLFGAGAVSDDFLLTNVTIYWLTNTAASSARLYYEDRHAGADGSEPTTFPLGLAGFADDFVSMRRFAERDHHNIVQWHTYDTGGHYSAHQVPDLLVADLREFFRIWR